jgi:UPF0755 protein
MAGVLMVKTRRRLGLFRSPIIIVIIICMTIVGLVTAAISFYALELRPVSKTQKQQVFTVKSGSSVSVIASSLQTEHLIRSSWAFELYTHTKRITSDLQAGDYSLSPSQSTQSIVNTLTKGRTDSSLVTILPGRRIDQVRSDLINAGFSPTDVDIALDPSQYADVPIMTIKPQGILTLEGLLWPDSFASGPQTKPQDIIRKSLLEASDNYTPDLQAAIAAHGLNPYQGLTLASVVEQEVSKPSDQPQVAQVFLTRLQEGMKLGSDVTARYGAISAGLSPSLTYDSSYNTLLHSGLPPTPISSVSSSSLNAVAHPANTAWLYFVTGDDGTTYFSTTFAQHQAYTDKYCHKLCGR